MKENLEKTARQGQFDGEKNLKNFIGVVDMITELLLVNAMELHGHIAAVKAITMPEAENHDFDDSDASDYEIKML